MSCSTSLLPVSAAMACGAETQKDFSCKPLFQFPIIDRKLTYFPTQLLTESESQAASSKMVLYFEFHFEMFTLARDNVVAVVVELR